MSFRTVGSESNKNAIKYIWSEAQLVKSTYLQLNKMDYSGHRSSNFYQNIVNVAVKLEGQSTSSLLLNCHLDSAPGSPGASDDAANCCVMMEILEVLSQDSDKLLNSIIFLFSGAGVRGVHGFMNQNKWSKDVKAFVSLNSVGSGGKEILVNVNSKHCWMLKYYKKIPRPFAQVFLEELTKRFAILPQSDFKEFTNIPGLDFISIKDGQRHQTKNDDIQYLSEQFLQHTGENILVLTKALANSTELKKSNELIDNSTVIYYDYLGLIFIEYSLSVDLLVNLLVSLTAFLLPFSVQTRGYFTKESCRRIMQDTLFSFTSILVGTVLSAGMCCLMALFLQAIGKGMSWYTTRFLALGIYCSLSLTVHAVTYHTMSYGLKKMRNEKNQAINLVLQKYGIDYESDYGNDMHARLNGVNLFWGVVTLVNTGLSNRLGYLTMVPLTISVASNILIFLFRVVESHIMEKYFELSCNLESKKWIVLHIFIQTFTVLWTTYLCHILLAIIIPLLGKEHFLNPDILVGLFAAGMTVFSCSYFVSLQLLIKLEKNLKFYL